MNKRLERPDLVVPYQYIPMRDRAYPYVVAACIVIIIFLVLVMISVKEVA